MQFDIKHNTQPIITISFFGVNICYVFVYFKNHFNRIEIGNIRSVIDLLTSNQITENISSN